MITRSVKKQDLSGYNWKTYEVTNLKKENILRFFKERHVDTGEVDETFNRPVYIDTLGLKCILMFKDGKKQISSFNHVYKNNSIYLSTQEGAVPLSRVKGLKKILFMDDPMYHPEYRHLWSERDTFDFVEHFKTSGEFINKIAEAWS